MKLNQIQARILSTTWLDSTMSVQEIARAVKVKSHTVLYTLHRLRDAGVIHPFVLFNPHVLGLTDYCVFFNFQGEERQAHRKIIDYCVKSPQTGYVASLAGAHAYTVSLFCFSIFEVEHFFTQLSALLPRGSFSMSFALRCAWTILVPRFFDPRTPGQKFRSIVRTAEKQEAKIDRFDLDLIQVLGVDASQSNVAVAKKLGVSEATIRGRIRKLIEQKVILGMPYQINGDPLNYHSFRVIIVSKGPSALLDQQIRRFAQRHPHMWELVRCLGSWNFELNFLAPTSVKPSDILSEVQDELSPLIHSAYILSNLEIHKAHHFPPAAARALTERLSHS